jgi:hypothetical protein
MNFMKLVVSSLIALLPLFVNAQVKEQTGWFALINSTRFNERWGLHLDAQVRSSDNFDRVRNFMFRPGLTYFINKNHNVTAGYLLNDTYLPPGPVADTRLSEHRIWEQYIFNQKLKSTALMHRFRLEQRFIERPADQLFSQRFRYMLRAVVPLNKQDSAFSKGPFLGLQDEIFLHLQNKDQLNKSVFDQNRAYIALGYRFSKKFDLEAGYLNQFIKGATVNTSNNVIQLAVYTRF